jgi:hypothetical protein
MANYVCTTVGTKNILTGDTPCKAWTELPADPSLIPDLTITQVNQLAIAFITVLVIAWGFKTIAQFIREF